MSAGLGAFATIILSTLLGPAAEVAIVPVQVDLGVWYSRAWDLNDDGMVLGYAYRRDTYSYYSFVWTESGGVVDLGDVQAAEINETGMVVGNIPAFEGTQSTAFVWTQSDGIVDLGTLGGSGSRPNWKNALSEAGQVIGTSETADGSTHAFSWTAAGGMVDVGTLGGSSSEPVAVNERGVVVGNAETADGSTHAFSWTAARGMIDLGTLGGSSSWATGVNDSGMVVGYAETGNGHNHAFSWTEAGGMIDLGTLGDSWGAPAVNERGMVVGFAVAPDGYSHAFSWTQSSGMVDRGELRLHGPWGGGVVPCGTIVALSDTGQVAVRCDQGERESHSFYWSETSGLVGIETTRWVFAEDMNDWGQLIGFIGGTPPRTLFTWTETRGMTLLAEVLHPVWYFSPSPRVSNRGRVVGTTGSFSSSTGMTRATMWKTDPDSECVLLQETIDAMGLPFGTRTSLAAKLSGARAALADGDAATACKHVADVISFASAQAGKKLTVDQANDIVGPATDIRTMLQCP